MKGAAGPQPRGAFTSLVGRLPLRGVLSEGPADPQTPGCLFQRRKKGRCLALVSDGRNRPVEEVIRGPLLAFCGNGLSFGEFIV